VLLDGNEALFGKNPHCRSSCPFFPSRREGKERKAGLNRKSQPARGATRFGLGKEPPNDYLSGV
jgi:hypothetical protein